MGAVGKGNSRTRPAELGYTPRVQNFVTVETLCGVMEKAYEATAPCTPVRTEVTGSSVCARRFHGDPLPRPVQEQLASSEESPAQASERCRGSQCAFRSI